MSPPTLAQLRRLLTEKASPKYLHLARDPRGGVLLTMVSQAFNPQGDPYGQVCGWIEGAGFALPKPLLTTLYHPDELEPEEEAALAPRRSVRTWADALVLEPGADAPEDTRGLGGDVKVVAFWSVKGGVGRTTTLAHVASLLGREGIRCLAVDLDLDAPALASTWAREPAVEPRFDHLVRLAARQDTEQGTLDRQVRLGLHSAPIVSDRLAILGPVTADDSFVTGLLSDLRPSALVRGDDPSLYRLLRTAAAQHRAQLVLLDVRSGYCLESALGVLDLADEVVVFASAAPSTYRSLTPAVHALERQRLAWGRPSQIHLALGLLPAGQEARKRAIEELTAVSEKARQDVVDSLGVGNSELSDDIEPITIDYVAKVVENDGHISTGVGGYKELAVRLSRLVHGNHTAEAEGTSEWGGSVLREAEIPVPQSEDGNIEHLARIFTRTSELEQFVRPEKALVLGPKGTGKTYLRRIALERPDLLEDALPPGAPTPRYIDAFSLRGSSLHPSMSAPLMQELQRHAADSKDPSAWWSDAWSAIALSRVLCQPPMTSDAVRAKMAPFDHELRTLRDQTSGSQDVANALISLSQRGLDLHDLWTALDGALADEGAPLYLLFDDLDVALGQTDVALNGRRDLILGLVDRFEGSWAGAKNIAAKILLREDLFRTLRLEEAAKYASRAVRLSWESEDIWRLAVRAMAVASRTFRHRLDENHIDVDHLEEMGSRGWEAPLRWLWGERMGSSSSSTRTAGWVVKRLTDGQARLYPRAVLWLLEEAIDQRKEQGGPWSGAVLNGRALRDAMPAVANKRRHELEAETTDCEWRLIECLKGFESYMDRDEFVRSLAGASSDPKADEILRQLHELGVVEFGERRDGTKTVRIVDLYAFARDLQIKRLGRR